MPSTWPSLGELGGKAIPSCWGEAFTAVQQNFWKSTGRISPGQARAVFTFVPQYADHIGRMLGTDLGAQMPEQNETSKYPLLEELLAGRGMYLQATYTNRDAAVLFGVSIRAIQDRVSSDQLTARDLPGRARFLSIDLEEFLQNSIKRKRKSRS